MALIERVVGTGDPDLLVMLREAEKVGRGAHGRGRPLEEGESPSSISDDQTGKTAARLARDAPNVYAAVQAGELTINAPDRMTFRIRPSRGLIRPPTSPE